MTLRNQIRVNDDDASNISTVLSTPLHSSVLWLIPFLPLFGAILNGATGRWLKNTKLVDAIALGSVGVSFLLVVCIFTQLWARPRRTVP